MRKMLIILALALGGCGMEYSDGTRVGVVQKLSKKGFICKTWEGEVLLSGQNVLQPEKFKFSVTDERVIPELQEAMKSGRQVELLYKQLIFNGPCTPESSYRIIQIK